MSGSGGLYFLIPIFSLDFFFHGSYVGGRGGGRKMVIILSLFLLFFSVFCLFSFAWFKVMSKGQEEQTQKEREAKVKEKKKKKRQKKDTCNYGL